MGKISELAFSSVVSSLKFLLRIFVQTSLDARMDGCHVLIYRWFGGDCPRVIRYALSTRLGCFLATSPFFLIVVCLPSFLIAVCFSSFHHYKFTRPLIACILDLLVLSEYAYAWSFFSLLCLDVVGVCLEFLILTCLPLLESCVYANLVIPKD